MDVVDGSTGRAAYTMRSLQTFVGRNDRFNPFISGIGLKCQQAQKEKENKHVLVETMAFFRASRIVTSGGNEDTA